MSKNMGGRIFMALVLRLTLNTLTRTLNQVMIPCTTSVIQALHALVTLPHRHRSHHLLIAPRSHLGWDSLSKENRKNDCLGDICDVPTCWLAMCDEASCAWTYNGFSNLHWHSASRCLDTSRYTYVRRKVSLLNRELSKRENRTAFCMIKVFL